MIPPESLKRKSSEITGTCISLSIFASLKFSRWVTKLHGREHFVQLFEKWDVVGDCHILQ